MIFHFDVVGTFQMDHVHSVARSKYELDGEMRLMMLMRLNRVQIMMLNGIQNRAATITRKTRCVNSQRPH